MTSTNQNWVEQCEAEPLAHSGAIQPHGGLLHLDGDLRVGHASANLDRFLPLVAEPLLDQPLPEAIARLLRPSLEALGAAPGTRAELLGARVADRPPLDLVLTRGLSGVIVELFEHENRPTRYPTEDMPMRTPSDAASATELHRTIAARVHDLTGFDRVMIYAFREDGDGEVLAEARRPEAYGSYLGLRFPGSDIPLIARNLYQKNPWRLIPDSQAASVPLLSRRGAPPDLTWSDLRSVSPVHQIYLANMAVRASLSLPIMAGGKLWGLIACHHAEPRTMTLRAMRLASQIARHYGMVLSTWIAEERMRFVEKLDQRFAATRTIVQGHGDLVAALPDIAPDLLELFAADGMAIRVGDVWAHTGRTPDLASLDQLSESLHGMDGESLRMNDSLARTYPELGSLPVAGALVVKMFTRGSDFLQVWLFRDELAHEVEWGGNPDKPVEFDDGRFGIAPRRSFEKWVEKRTGYCRPWLNGDRLAAMRLRQLLIELCA